MAGTKDIQKIVREYFDNAIFIDDELFYKQLETVAPADMSFDESLLEDEGGGIFADAAKEAAAAFQNVNGELKDRADKTLEELIAEGFITYPCRYENQANYDHLQNVLKNSKLLIVDWNLENTRISGDMGLAALNFLSVFTAEQKGLKCAVIYTSEPDQVENKLSREYETIKLGDNELFFRKKVDDHNYYLLGFVVSKRDTLPQDIMQKISDYLYHNKSITIHLMDSANRLDRSLDKVINRYDVPFESVLFSQILTSDTPGNQIYNLINELLISTVLEQGSHVDEATNFLFLSKKESLLKSYPSVTERSTDVEQLCGLITGSWSEKERGYLLRFLMDDEVLRYVCDVLGDIRVESLELLEEKLRMKLNESEIIQKSKKFDEISQKVVKSSMIFLLLWDLYFKKGSKENFEKSLQQEAYNLTLLRKYVDNRVLDKKIETGTIFNHNTENSSLICITPFCDTFRTESIGNRFKFLVGTGIDNPRESEIKNNSMSSYVLATPSNNDQIGYIKYVFYDVVTMSLEQLIESGYTKGLTLKKEYIQKVINQYIAYQSRAGVDEMFYKESAYINNFLPLFARGASEHDQ